MDFSSSVDESDLTSDTESKDLLKIMIKELCLSVVKDKQAKKMFLIL